jgi:hypothetical protein
MRQQMAAEANQNHLRVRGLTPFIGTQTCSASRSCNRSIISRSTCFRMWTHANLEKSVTLILGSRKYK